MNFLSKLWETAGISGAASGSPLSNYVMGDTVSSYDPSHKGIWTMKTGQPKKGASSSSSASGGSLNGVNGPITIFEYDPKRVPGGREPFAKNGLRRTKTLRHPSILSYIDSAEPTSGGATSVIIATECSTPLGDNLDELRRFPSAVAWGILQVAKAVSFLNDCQVIHGNISTSTVFVTRSGDWKLWGLEMATEVASLGSSSLVSISGDLATGERPPECVGYGWGDKIDKSCACAIDAYMFGKFVEDVFSQLGMRMPQELAASVARLTAMDPHSRMLVKELMEIGYFVNPYVDALTFLDNITLKENAEKDAFFSSVLAPLVDQIPSKVALYKVLPHLISTIEFGYSQPSVKKIMPVLLKLVKDLPENDFATIVTPHIVKWFAASDRIMRACLLESISCYVDKLPKSAISDKIFPCVATGFVDASPVIRDLTVRSMISFVPMLPEKIVNVDVLRYFSRVQIDPETKGKVLIPAFTRALKDSFAPARVAGVVALYLTREYYTPLECACSIIPAIAPHLLDPDKNVRDESKRLLNSVMEKVNAKADEMAIADENKAAAAAAAAATTQTTKEETSGNSQGDQGWSLIQSISKKITSTTSDVKPSQNVSTMNSTSTSTSSSSSSMKLGMNLSSNSTSPAAGTAKTQTTTTTTSTATTAKQAAATTKSDWDIDDDGFGDDDNWGDSDNLIFNAVDTKKQTQPSTTATTTTTSTFSYQNPTSTTATAPSKGMTLGTQRQATSTTGTTARKESKKEDKKPVVTKLSGAWDWDDDGGDGW